MPRPRLISVVGIDGSGKTTQARALAARLVARGVPAVYFENPGGRPVIDRIARRLGRRDGRAMLGRYGYLAVEVGVRGVFLARALLWSRLTGRVAVLDRYGPCQFALMRARGDRGERLVRAAYRPFRRPDVVLWLEVTPEVAYERVARRGTDREDLAYLAAFDAAYRTLRECQSWIAVDANRPEAQVAAQIDAAVSG
jgi:dTMP kinase